MSERFRSGPEDSNKIKKEIEDGVIEYKEGVAEFAGEKSEREDDWQELRELNKPEVSPEVSARNLEAGLERAKEIIGQIKGDFIGAHFVYNFHGYRTGRLVTLEAEGEKEIIKKLTLGGDWYPLFDDQLTYSGKSSGDASHFLNYIGAKEISSSDFSSISDAETFYYVAGQPVTGEDYEKFKKKVREMLYENYRERGAQEVWVRELPPKIDAKVKKMSFDHRTEQVLKDGRAVSPGVIHLKHIYGSSYFGSGGGYGSVGAFDLEAWKQGKRVKKEIATKDGDNGFSSGPNEITIESNTIVICKGGDAIGDKGRSWEEIYICE